MSEYRGWLLCRLWRLCNFKSVGAERLKGFWLWDVKRVLNFSREL